MAEVLPPFLSKVNRAVATRSRDIFLVASGSPTMTMMASPRQQLTSNLMGKASASAKATARQVGGQNTGKHGGILGEQRRKGNAVFAASRERGAGQNRYRPWLLSGHFWQGFAILFPEQLQLAVFQQGTNV
jgi:hypothetical protein